MVMAIREAKDLNKITLDEICDSLLKYKQKVNQIKEEEKKEAVGKKKSLTLKMSSHEEEIGESFYKDEDAEMAMLAKRNSL
ncbi:hypothetical protein CRYUN_Cryun02cG0103100 [Craigia yunnanensis]